MPITRLCDIAHRFEEQRFWRDYFSCGELSHQVERRAPEYGELAGGSIELPLAERGALVLELKPDLEVHTLFFNGASGQWQLGWADNAHFHPDVLRRTELDVISRYQQRLDPALGHPGAAYLLLHMFAPLTRGDRAGIEQQQLSRALVSTGAFDSTEADEFVSEIISERTELEWIERGSHWVLEGSDAYTLRFAGNPSFPFDELESALQVTAAQVRRA